MSLYLSVGICSAMCVEHTAGCMAKCANIATCVFGYILLGAPSIVECSLDTKFIYLTIRVALWGRSDALGTTENDGTTSSERRRYWQFRKIGSFWLKINIHKFPYCAYMISDGGWSAVDVCPFGAFDRFFGVKWGLELRVRQIYT